MFRHTEEARKRISESLKQQYLNGTRLKIKKGSETANKISHTLKNKVEKGEYIVWHKGKKLPSWVKKKLSEAHIGQKGKDHPMWKGGKIKTVCVFCNKEIYIGRYKLIGNKYVYCSVDCHHKHMSISGSFSGKNNPKWKGGITPAVKIIRHSLEYKKWRNAVFQRDNYTCIWCGIKGVELNADHIILFSENIEKRFEVDNGRTLCVKCHKRRHSIKKDMGELDDN